MALGKVTDINLARTAALTGGPTWSTDLPLANLVTDDRYVAAPARQLDAANLEGCWFEAELAAPRAINFLALLFHTLSLAARFRLTVRGIGGTWDEPALQTDWTDVYGRIFDSSALEWEASNWWTGQITEEEIDLFPRHLWVTPAPVLATALRIEIDDVTHPDGWFDVGGLWIASSWSPAFNYERGRSLTLKARDQVEEGPSGRRFNEERDPRRQLAVTYAGLTTSEAYRWFDAAARARVTRPVIFMPDADHEPTRVRETFPANFEQPPGPRFTYEHAHQLAATFSEILA